jgi:hypothetical protein
MALKLKDNEVLALIAKALKHKNFDLHPVAHCGCKRCHFMGFTAPG